MSFPLSGAGSASSASRASQGAYQAAIGMSDKAQDMLESASQLGVPNTQALAQQLGKVSDPAERTALLNEIAPSLPERQAADVGAELDRLGKPTPLDEDAVAAQAAKKDDGGIDGDLAMDLTQMGLDVAGIFDPTPISDGANTLISLGRGDWLGAALSAISIIPYVGDAAKLGKLGKWAETVAKAIDAVKANPAMREALQPAMDAVKAALDKLPIDSLPESMRTPIQDLKTPVDEFGKLGKAVDFGNIPPQHHARYERYLAQAEAKGKTPLAPDDWFKKAEQAWANNAAGNSFEASVRKELDLPVGPGSKPVAIDGYLPDFPVGKEWGVTDVKNVKDVTSSPQLDAFYKYAKENGLPFNIVIGPNTQSVSAPLIDKILETGGKILKMEDGVPVSVSIQQGTRLTVN